MFFPTNVAARIVHREEIFPNLYDFPLYAASVNRTHVSPHEGALIEDALPIELLWPGRVVVVATADVGLVVVLIAYVFFYCCTDCCRDSRCHCNFRYHC